MMIEAIIKYKAENGRFADSLSLFVQMFRNKPQKVSEFRREQRSSCSPTHATQRETENLVNV